MQTLLIATKNKGKIQEISSFLADLPLKMVSLKDVGISQDVHEDQKTYRLNSQKKALFYAKLSGLPVIADDGGIEIVALNGAPGIKSRRYFGKGGKEATDEEIIVQMKKLAGALADGNRGAKFIVADTLALPNGKSWTVTAEVKGVIARKPYLKLLHGYPYRSFFYLPKLNKYYHESELTRAEQKLYNHRYRAIQKLKPMIRKVLSI